MEKKIHDDIERSRGMIQAQLGDLDAVSVQAILFNKNDNTLQRPSQDLYNRVKNRNYGYTREIIKGYGANVRQNQILINSLNPADREYMNLMLDLADYPRLPPPPISPSNGG
jgi:hypothetical protein